MVNQNTEEGDLETEVGSWSWPLSGSCIFCSLVATLFKTSSYGEVYPLALLPCGRKILVLSQCNCQAEVTFFDGVSECLPGWKETASKERKEQFPPKYPVPSEHQHSVCLSSFLPFFFLQEEGRFAVCVAVQIYGLVFLILAACSLMTLPAALSALPFLAVVDVSPMLKQLPG